MLKGFSSSIRGGNFKVNHLAKLFWQVCLEAAGKYDKSVIHDWLNDNYPLLQKNYASHSSNILSDA